MSNEQEEAPREVNSDRSLAMEGISVQELGNNRNEVDQYLDQFSKRNKPGENSQESEPFDGKRLFIRAITFLVGGTMFLIASESVNKVSSLL